MRIRSAAQVLFLATALLLMAGVAAAADAPDNCMTIWQQLDDLERDIPPLQQLFAELGKKTETLRDAHKEINAFNLNMRLTLKLNTIKATAAAMIDLMTEAQGFVSGGAAVDVAKWVVNKAASQVMGKTLGGPSYYSKHMQSMKAAADDLSPKVAVFNRLRALPLDSFRVYDRNGQLLGDTSAILNRGRSLIGASDTTMRSIYRTFMELDRIHTNAEQELALLTAEREMLRERLAKCRRDADHKDEPVVRSVAADTPVYAPEPAKAKISTAGPYRKCEHYPPPMQRIIAQVKDNSEKVGELLQTYRTTVEAGYAALGERLGEIRQAATDEAAAINSARPKRVSILSDGELKWVLEHGDFPRDVSFQTILTQTESARAALDQLAAHTEHELTSFADSVPLNVDAMGVGAEVDSIRQLEAKNAVLEGNYRALRSAAPRDCRAVYTMPLSIGHGSVGIVAAVNADLERFASLKNGVVRAIEASRLENERYRTAFKANFPLVRRHFDYLLESARYDAKERLQQVADSTYVAEGFIAAATALLDEYRRLTEAGVLEYFVGNGGMDNYNLNTQWLDQLASTIDANTGSCGLVQGLADLTQVMVSRVTTLREAAKSAHGGGAIVFPSLQTGYILTHNAPTLAAQLRNLEPAVRRLQAQLQETERRNWNTSSNINILDILVTVEIHNVRAKGVLGSLASVFEKHARIMQVRLQALASEAERLVARERIPKGEAERLAKSLPSHRAYFDDNLACLGDQDPWIKSFPDLFARAEKAIAKLRGKPTYFDATALIQRLTQLKEQVVLVGIADTDAFYRELDTIESGYKAARDEYLTNAATVQSVDKDQIDGLLDRISRQLAMLHEQQPPRSSVVDDAAVRALYQTFSQAYNAQDVDGLTRLLAEEWRGAGDALIDDVENNLDNSFRVFDRVSFKILNLQVTPMSDGQFKVSYQADIKGEIRRPRLTHQESVNVVDIVGPVDGHMRILNTLSGRHFIKR